eukprot:4965155-Pyramimonas_sp.AAC.1
MRAEVEQYPDWRLVVQEKASACAQPQGYPELTAGPQRQVTWVRRWVAQAGVGASVAQEHSRCGGADRMWADADRDAHFACPGGFVGVVGGFLRTTDARAGRTGRTSRMRSHGWLALNTD